MAIPVDVKDVERVLNPWLGTMLLSSSPIAAEIAHEVMEYAPYRQTFQELKETIDHDLFAGVSRATGGSIARAGVFCFGPACGAERKSNQPSTRPSQIRPATETQSKVPSWANKQ